jgi:hypothetical protein
MELLTATYLAFPAKRSFIDPWAAGQIVSILSTALPVVRSTAPSSRRKYDA